MNLTRSISLFLFVSLFLIPLVHAEIITVFNLSSETVCLEVWKGFNNDAKGNVTFHDGKFHLWINDTSGGWGLSKISRGLMPHHWGLRYALLDHEFEFEKDALPDVTLTIGLNLLKYTNYTVNNSSMNVAIVLFFDGYITDYQEKCYQTEIQFFSYYGNAIHANEKWFFTWRNDSVAQFKLGNHLDVDAPEYYTVNLAPYINEMMNHYGLNNAKLKHIEIFTEAYKGFCEFHVYSAQITVRTRAPSDLLFAFIPLILVAVCIGVLKAFYKKKERKRNGDICFKQSRTPMRFFYSLSVWASPLL